MEKKRVALYARVSTLNGQNPEMQLSELRDYCQRRGFAVANEYVDKGISGARERRPALDKLMADCRKRLVDALWTHLCASRLRIRGTTKNSRHSPWFHLWQQYGVCCRTEPPVLRLPELGTINFRRNSDIPVFCDAPKSNRAHG
jgi:hypothetical protein